MAAHGITGAGNPPNGGRSLLVRLAAAFRARDSGGREAASGCSPLILDGATGTELERHGVPSALPLWSARALLEAPDVLETIHRSYVAAGAEALTANTFRTQRRSLARAGLGARAAELTRQAVVRARAAARSSESPVFVLGSQAPLEDCYHPERVPSDDALEHEHAEHARHLAAAGVDGILVETMNTVREARHAAAAALATGVPTFVSFVCDAEARLLSGEPLRTALAALADLGVHAVLVNCLPPRAVLPALPALRDSGLPFGAYANLGAPGASDTEARMDECSPDEFAAHARAWCNEGACLVGGCCGTGPAHVRALKG
jgi:S-methylmethionine-dependent homocysteine/selenocysteine methylase